MIMPDFEKVEVTVPEVAPNPLKLNPFLIFKEFNEHSIRTIKGITSYYILKNPEYNIEKGYVFVGTFLLDGLTYQVIYDLDSRKEVIGMPLEASLSYQAIKRLDIGIADFKNYSEFNMFDLLSKFVCTFAKWNFIVTMNGMGVKRV